MNKAKQTMNQQTFALLVSIEYRHTHNIANLQGATNDAKNLAALLTTTFAVPTENIRILSDTLYAPCNDKYPSLHNVMTSFSDLIQKVKSIERASQLIFFVAAHGKRVTQGYHTFTMIKPADWHVKGYLHPLFILNLLQTLPAACHVCTFLDVCYAGNMLMLPINVLNNNHHSTPFMQLPCSVTQLSSCTQTQKSVEARFNINDTYTPPQGPLVTSLCWVFNHVVISDNQPCTATLVQFMQDWLAKNNIFQTLECFSNRTDANLVQLNNRV